MIATNAAMARGAVLTARKLPSQALGPLVRARQDWLALDAAYEAARARVLIAKAYEMMGDRVSAELEVGLAHEVFERLGARPDLQRLTTAARPPDSMLSKRELDVLRLVATGKTSKETAADLHVSVRTVDRHLSNIYTKLGVGSRTAAAAYAFEEGLL